MLNLNPLKQARTYTLATAVALCLSSSISANAESDLTELTLGSGDVVVVSVLNRPELSGSFRVRADGMISMHFLGELSATGLNESALEEKIEKLLERQTSLPTSATVEVAEWRAVTVGGDVTNPGNQTFNVGQTVAEALSLAGGAFPRAGETSGSSLEVRIASEIAEIERRKLLLADLHARRIRLEAEAAGTEQLDSNADLEKYAGSLAPVFLDAQTEILNAQRSEESIEIANSRERAILAKSEVEALERQQDILNVSINESREELKKADDLQARGLLTGDRPRSLRRTLNDEQIQLMETTSFKARAQQQVAQSEAAADALRARRQTDIVRELYSVTAEIERTMGEIASSRGLLARVQPFAQSSAVTEVELAPPYFRIRRTDSDGVVEVQAADVDTRLRPGDVLEVKRGGWLTVPAD